VLAQTAVEAEVLTKTAFILGGVDGLRAVESAGAKALIIDAEGKSWTSPGLSLEPVTP
jgi:thiamine biosynthesis lipoprotein ApbE